MEVGEDLRTKFNFLHHVKIFPGEIRAVINSGCDVFNSEPGTLVTGFGFLENLPLLKNEP